ncbi:Uncharacterised protein [Trueperella bialowiezensis]|uniref:Uncharacterized protein n=1 Tax=Trueperella bialowiezensis TaxID=312285 RepID=A0A448PGH5_9ACTO|nr:Uncharacterised protein [Trueperella bialowiezensis]
MDDCHNKQQESSLSSAVPLKAIAFVGSTQLVALALFYFVTKVNEAGTLLASILEMSSLTVLIGLFLKKGIILATTIAFLFISFVISTFVGLATHRYALSAFSALTSFSLGLMLYLPSVSNVNLPHVYQLPQISLIIPLLFATPLLTLVIQKPNRDE